MLEFEEKRGGGETVVKHKHCEGGALRVVREGAHNYSVRH